MSDRKAKIDPNYKPENAGKYKSGNEGKLHTGMKHWGYAWRSLRRAG